ncbi:uncharacterized protein DUF3196 [Entomoplasma freundtii]|uniref:Uncharacterized protein n=1 Tax=Entomoplasma freundtii TaxID=74700 RepID=A0A2K8NRF7_9MOLU|nr:DUF3196 family protein [Entomoplasma freundtii]ATZ16412.1 hypothetical protein EFREU_v1c03860 [Entomoplasma freundtii]TDY56549.1 uncharacterized protein DUF3196 [Entomoplasma freundtii]
MFYKDLEKKILALIANNEIEEASKLIEEELKMPYIPQEFETFLLKMQKDIFFKTRGENTSLEETSLTIEALLNKLESAKLTDQTWAVINLENYNLRPHLKELETFLLRKNIPDDLKTMLLMTLHQQQIPNLLQLWKNNQVLKVVPSELKVTELMDFFHETKLTIMNHNWLKNTTWEALSIKLALIFLLNYFPKTLDFSVTDLAAATDYKALNLLGESGNWEILHSQFQFNESKAKKILIELDKFLVHSEITE